ncbi:MAG: nodulation protein NfeD [Candidatus Eremiobacteraeota bacterium]|nr:nodulation protein NfeD [Candidatus Eremiobacteraeota bacterium]
MKHSLRAVRFVVVCASLLAGFVSFAAGAALKPHAVQVVDIDGVINAGMAHRVQRAIDDAHANGASTLLVEIKTNGGLIDDANDIKDALRTSGLTTIAYVDRAWSAGALIALACDKIYMAPESSMGAAEPVLIGGGGTTQPAGEKAISAVSAEFRALAQAHHRDPDIAAAMVDPSLDVPGIKTKGHLLTLPAEQAKKLKFVDGIADTPVAALEAAGISSPVMATTQPSLGERIAQFVTDPIVSGILLTIGFLGLFVEMQTLHAIAGIIGVAALALFFGGHIIAGASNWVIIALFALGVVGLLFELHVLPGHGISGLIGALLILVSIVMAFGAAFWLIGIIYTSLALVLAIVIFFLLLRWLPESAFIRRIQFAGAQSVATGYVTSRPLDYLIGKSGIAETYLRPAGVASIDGGRYQVQSAGDFIPSQTRIVVTRVEGATVFVARAT